MKMKNEAFVFFSPSETLSTMVTDLNTIAPATGPVYHEMRDMWM